LAIEHILTVSCPIYIYASRDAALGNAIVAFPLPLSIPGAVIGLGGLDKHSISVAQPLITHTGSTCKADKARSGRYEWLSQFEMVCTCKSALFLTTVPICWLQATNLFL
jgi:hypothetical protein